jgi:hypothetical protein
VIAHHHSTITPTAHAGALITTEFLRASVCRLFAGRGSSVGMLQHGTGCMYSKDAAKLSEDMQGGQANSLSRRRLCKVSPTLLACSAHL